MNIREPREFQKLMPPRKKRKGLKKTGHVALIFLVVAAVTALAGYWSYSRAIPTVSAHTAPLDMPETSHYALAWPTGASAAIGVLNEGVLASSEKQPQTPMASVAKVMTALAVLKHHPLALGEQGPELTFTQGDVDIYNKYVAQEGSVVEVQVGEKMSEYQALQALLLPSANNIADSIAVWGFGSISEYHAFANNLAKSIGMNQTKFSGDASGFLPDSVSTSYDLVLLGQAAMQNPVIAEIVDQASANIPVVGTVHNVNKLVDREEIIGIKTGNTLDAGGCYLFATKHKFENNKEVITIGAVMNAVDLNTAIQDALPLLDSFYAGFGDINVAQKNHVAATYRAPWGANDNALLSDNVSIFGWKNAKLKVRYDLDALNIPAAKNKTVGYITISSTVETKKVPLVLSESFPAPSPKWRLLRH